MKIVHVITRSDTIGGGAHRHVFELSLELIKRGEQAIVLAGGRGAFSELLESHTIPYVSIKHLVRPINIFRDLLSIFEIRAVLKKLQPDLVSTHSAKAGWLARIAAFSLGIPAIYTVHGWAFNEDISTLKKLLFVNLERLISKITCMIILVSKYDYNSARKYSIGSKLKLRVIHNGVHDIHTLGRHDSNYINLIMVARFEKPKDHLTLLNSLLLLKNKKWKLDFVGDGPDLNICRQFVKDNSLDSKVKFLGLRDDVPALLNHYDIFILSSTKEGLPLSIIEAMSVGLPVVATNVGGNSELVDNNETGFLVERSDAISLANKLDILIGDESLRGRMGCNGRIKYLDDFNFNKMFNKTFLTYTETIESVR